MQKKILTEKELRKSDAAILVLFVGIILLIVGIFVSVQQNTGLVLRVVLFVFGKFVPIWLIAVMLIHLKIIKNGKIEIVEDVIVGKYEKEVIEKFDEETRVRQMMYFLTP